MTPRRVVPSGPIQRGSGGFVMSEDENNTIRDTGTPAAAMRPVAVLHRLHIAAEPRMLTDIRRQLAAWAASTGMSGEHVAALTLASYEAMANVAQHAYPHTTGHFDLHAVHRTLPHAATITVTVRDHGRWAPPPEQSGILHGRGLPLIHALTDRAVISTGESGTEIRMTWDFPYRDWFPKCWVLYSGGVAAGRWNPMSDLNATEPGRNVNTPDVELRTRADPGQLPVLRGVAAAIAIQENFDLDAVADIRLAMDETCTRLILRATAGALLTCRFQYLDSTLLVAVSTTTSGMNSADQRTFGWHVLNTLTDSVGLAQAEDPLSSSFVSTIEFTKTNTSDPA